MEQSFNLKRACLLFKSILIVNKKLLMVLPFGLVVVISILSIMDIIRSSDGILEFYYVGKYGRYILIGSLVNTGAYAGYSQYKNRLYINTSHIVPASTNEKFFASFVFGILTTIVVFVSYIIVPPLFGYISELINGKVGYLDTMLSTFINGPSKLMIPIFVAMYSVHCSFSILPKKYAWCGVFIWILATIIPLFVFPKNDLKLILPSIVLTLTLMYWTIMYFQFKKIEIKKSKYYGAKF